MVWFQNSLRSFAIRKPYNSSERTVPNDVLIYKQNNIIKQIDFLLDTFESAKMDILYMEKLKMPLTPDEQIYFISQIDRINSAIAILVWMQNSVKTKNTVFKNLLR